MSIMVRLFAVSVLLVGSLDMMLSWRRGLEANWFFVALLLVGMVLYAVSWIMQSGRSKSVAESVTSCKGGVKDE